MCRNIMDKVHNLTQDFVFMLELCLDPAELYREDTPENVRVHAWLQKMTLLECVDVDERRLRNIYMSHLIKCLNQGHLAGPFLGPPPDGPLRYVDFRAHSLEETYGERSTRDDEYDDHLHSDLREAMLPALNTYLKDRQSAGEQPNDQATHSELDVPSSYDFQERASFGNEDDVKSVASRYETNQVDPDVSNTNSYDDYKQQNVWANDSESDMQYTRIRYLLDAIRSELRGDSLPKENEFFEAELESYEKFISKFAHMKYALQFLKDSAFNMRSFMLLRLQDDLLRIVEES